MEEVLATFKSQSSTTCRGGGLFHDPPIGDYYMIPNREVLATFKSQSSTACRISGFFNLTALIIGIINAVKLKNPVQSGD